MTWENGKIDAANLKSLLTFVVQVPWLLSLKNEAYCTVSFSCKRFAALWLACGTDPSSKGGKGLCNYEPKLAEPSRNLFWRFFPSGILFYGFYILVFEFFLQSIFLGSNDLSSFGRWSVHRLPFGRLQWFLWISSHSFATSRCCCCK